VAATRHGEAQCGADLQLALGLPGIKILSHPGSTVPCDQRMHAGGRLAGAPAGGAAACCHQLVPVSLVHAEGAHAHAACGWTRRGRPSGRCCWRLCRRPSRRPSSGQPRSAQRCCAAPRCALLPSSGLRCAPALCRDMSGFVPKLAMLLRPVLPGRHMTHHAKLSPPCTSLNLAARVADT